MHVVVLGGGSTGEHFVGALRRLDDEVRITLVERLLVGGDCSYWACMPTKTMLRATEVVAETTRAPGVRPTELDIPRVFAWRDVVAERDDASQVEWLAKQRCELVRGDGVVASAGTIAVDGAEIAYDRLVIATGSSPVIPPIPGLDKIAYWTNVEATETTEVPGSLLVLGGGPVGCELAQFFARVGSRVTLVDATDRLLPHVDAEAASLVEAALREDGVEIHLGVTVEAVEPSNKLLLGSGERLEFERLLVATGRRANVDGLEPLGLEISKRGIEVDERMRAAENVWAIGDVTGIAQFTHVGKYHARVAAYDIAGRPARADYRAIPATIFTDPPVATVGVLEGAIARWPLTSTSRLSTYERPKRDGFVKVAADPERRVVVGAVAVGPEAGEWLQQLTLAIRAEVPIEVLLDVIQPFPTFSEAVFWALRELNLDLYCSPRFTPARGGLRPAGAEAAIVSVVHQGGEPTLGERRRPDAGDADGRQEQDGCGDREPRGDLAQLGLPADARAERLVDGVDLVRGLRVVRLAARDPGDRLHRRGIRRDRDLVLVEPEPELDRAVRGAERHAVDADARLLRELSRLDRRDGASVLARRRTRARSRPAGSGPARA